MTSLLLGAAIGFNWLWLGGLYNFLIGAMGQAVTLGLFFRWQARLGLGRIVGLSVLILVVYVSHIVTFGVLVAALILIAVFSEPRERRRACGGVLAALMPVTLLVLVYGSGGTRALGDEPLFPVWRLLFDPWSIASWVSHIRTADPFFLISRRALPSSTATSSMFAVFTPLLWLLIATAVLAWGTVWRRTHGKDGPTTRRHLPLVVVFAACVLAAAFGPDDFGTSHGTLLRQRLAFLAAVLFVPLYRTEVTRNASRAFAHLCLAGLILFQTTALWDYARQTSRDASEFLAVGDALEGQESLACVIVLENGQRFPSNPTAEMSNFLGIGRRTMVWDNYQIGYTLFPVVARNPPDRRFAFDLTSVNVFDEAEPAPVWDARLARLAAFFAAKHSRIGTVVVWRRNHQVEAVLGRWYEAEPFFEHRRARLYRHAGSTDPASVPGG